MKFVGILFVGAICGFAPPATPEVGAQSRLDDVGDPLSPGVVYRLGSMRTQQFRLIGVRFSPDDRTIALVFNDCTVWMWDCLAMAKP